MVIVFGFFAGLAVVLAFALGVVIGTRFCCPQGRDCCCGKNCRTFSEANSSVMKAESDPEKQRQYEENQKAFEDCMNYSAVQAYERKGVNRHGM